MKYYVRILSVTREIRAKYDKLGLSDLQLKNQPPVIPHKLTKRFFPTRHQLAFEVKRYLNSNKEKLLASNSYTAVLKHISMNKYSIKMTNVGNHAEKFVETGDKCPTKFEYQRKIINW